MLKTHGLPDKLDAGIFYNKRGSGMKKFEYKIIRIWGTGENAARTLNELGRQGWELMQVVRGSWHYFKWQSE